MNFSQKKLYLLIGILSLSAFATQAQDKQLTAEIRLIDRQKQLIDSAFINKTSLFEQQYESSNTFENYQEEWSSTDIDPYQVAFAQFPDSFVVDVTSYVPPLETNRITSNFGPRWGRLHAGTDFGLRTGDTIRAAFDGKVRISKYNRGGYGYYIVLKHPNGLETVYGHLSKFLVDVGDEVFAGDVIALGGSTGRSTGPHLHFETRFLGKPINPAQIIDFKNFVPYDDYFVIKKKETFKANNIPKGQKKKGGKYYTVRRGDTLGGIASRNKVSLSKLYKLNKMNSRTVLRAGRRIKLS
jgi:murein DD-endopeptidase MepM/ murein hydrolase activator NlpD